jgi:lysophospholipase L1-like esterase
MRVATALVGLILAACGTSPSVEPSRSAEPSVAPSASALPSATAPDVVVVAIGDSIPYNSPDDCPDCTGFVDSYGAALQAELGEPVEVDNRSRHDGARTIDIVRQLETDAGLRAKLATADVVLMSVGFNDQPPFADAHDGCPDPVNDNSTFDTVIDRAAATSHDCIDAVVREVQAQIAEVFAAVREQAPTAGIAALTAYDTWLGWSALESVDRETRTRLLAAERYWFHEWRRAMCAEAADVGAVCIDVYAAFNGGGGNHPAGELVASDYTHPSQEGNDVIRALLLEANLAADVTP